MANQVKVRHQLSRPIQKGLQWGISGVQAVLSDFTIRTEFSVTQNFKMSRCLSKHD